MAELTISNGPGFRNTLLMSSLPLTVGVLLLLLPISLGPEPPGPLQVLATGGLFGGLALIALGVLLIGFVLAAVTVRAEFGEAIRFRRVLRGGASAGPRWRN